MENNDLNQWVEVSGGRTVCNHCWNYPLYDYFGRLKLSDFCPNCGARMLEGRKTKNTEDEVCEACEITYSWERGSANVLGETNDADDRAGDTE